MAAALAIGAAVTLGFATLALVREHGRHASLASVTAGGGTSGGASSPPVYDGTEPDDGIVAGPVGEVVAATPTTTPTPSTFARPISAASSTSTTPKPTAASTRPATTTSTTTTTAPAAVRGASWRSMADSPLSQREHPTAAWTGTRLLVFGGLTPTHCEQRCGQELLVDGALYDPATNRWTAMAPSPLRSRPTPAAVLGAVVAGHLVVLDADTREVADYDVATDRWRTVTPPDGVEWTVPVATDHEVLLLGGALCSDACGRPHGVGAAFDPVAGTWRNLTGGPVAVGGRSTGWTGREVLLWSQNDDSGRWSYDPATDAWAQLAPRPGPLYNWPAAQVWDGHRWIIGPVDASTDIAAIEAYDPVARTWATLADVTSAHRGFASFVWTGTQVLIWGGRGEHVYRPAEEPPELVTLDTGTGATTALPSSPLGLRNDGVAVWTGTDLLVWGGWIRGGGAGEPQGAIYRP